MMGRQAAPETRPRHAGQRNRACRRPSSTQGRIKPRTAAGLVKENQVEPTKRAENPNDKRAAATRPTRGAVADAVVHTRDEIRDLPAQEIVDVEGGTSLTIPGAP